MKRCMLIGLSCLIATIAQANAKENVAYVDVQTRQAVFHLSENPTTGFRWYVTSELNPLVENITYDYEAPSAAIPGKPGMANFVITVKAEAMTAPRIIPISLKSARAWEPEVGQEAVLWLIVPAA